VGKYNIVFTVDSDVKMNVTVHFMCTEEVLIFSHCFATPRSVFAGFWINPAGLRIHIDLMRIRIHNFF
jgi:hypothetical protein